MALWPAVTDPTHADLLAISWRWTPLATLTNEVRGGFNLTYGYFLNAQGNLSNIVIPPIPSGATDALFTDPVNEFQTQGRTTNTYNLSDDAAWQHGRHYVQFGAHFQHIGIENYNRAGVIPTFTLGWVPVSRRLRVEISREFQYPTATANAVSDAGRLCR
jgi:hypothetical protein